jgi:transposase-like protein
MVENPVCPNCGRRMIVAREPLKPREAYTFECQHCHLLFMANDHEPVAGPPIYSTKSL